MFARGVFSFYSPHFHASSCFPSKPFVSPTCEITVPNFFCFRCLRKNRGYAFQKMSARRHFLSRFPGSPRSLLLPFNHLRTLSFSVAHLSAVLPISSALFLKKQGGLPLSGHTNCFRADWTCKTCPPRKAAATGEWFHESPVNNHSSPVAGHWSPVAGYSLHSPAIHNSVTGPSPILLPLLSQCSPVRGPTLTPCLSLSECLRYTSTDAICPARFLHETRTDY
jgi:hypothetical protein